MDTCMDVDEFHRVSEVDHEGTALGFGGVELLPYRYFGNGVAYRRRVYGTSSCCVFGRIGGSVVAIAFPHFPVESKIVGSLPPKFFSLGFLPIT